MKLITVMKAIALAVDAVAEDLPLATVHAEVVKDLIAELNEEERYLLQTCICAEAGDIIHGI